MPLTARLLSVCFARSRAQRHQQACAHRGARQADARRGPVARLLVRTRCCRCRCCSVPVSARCPPPPPPPPPLLLLRGEARAGQQPAPGEACLPARAAAFLPCSLPACGQSCMHSPPASRRMLPDDNRLLRLAAGRHPRGCPSGAAALPTPHSPLLPTPQDAARRQPILHLRGLRHLRCVWAGARAGARAAAARPLGSARWRAPPGPGAGGVLASPSAAARPPAAGAPAGGWAQSGELDVMEMRNAMSQVCGFQSRPV